MSKKDALKAILTALVVFVAALAIYLSTMADDYTTRSNYLPIAAAVEGRPNAPYFILNDISHPLWLPLGKIVYSSLRALGISLSGLGAMKFVSAFAAALSVSLFFLLLCFILAEIPISLLAALLLGFSSIGWTVATIEKNYALSGLFLVPAFWLLVWEDGRGWLKAAGAGILQALAVTAHISNLLFALPATLLIFVSRRPFRDRLINWLIYSAGSAVLTVIFFFLP